MSVSSRLVSSEQQCFSTSKAAFFEAHLKGNFQRQHQSPQTPFPQEAVSLPWTPATLRLRLWLKGGGLAGLRWREGGRVALAITEGPELPRGVSSRWSPSRLRVAAAPTVEAAWLGVLPLSELVFQLDKRCFCSCSNQKCCWSLTLTVVFLSKILL